MFSLSLREQILVASVVLAAVLGVAVKHWRDAQRESTASGAPPATQSVSVAGVSHPPAARAPGPPLPP